MAQKVCTKQTKDEGTEIKGTEEKSFQKGRGRLI